MRKSFLLFLLICCLFACQTSRTGEIDFSGEKLSLHKADLVISDADLLGDYKVIPFESNELYMIKSVDKILLFEDKIGVLDLSLRTLLIFNRQGGFLYEISHVGNGPGEYAQLLDVCLDPVDSCFAFLTAQHTVMFYSYTGEFKYAIKTEKAAQRMAIKDDYIYFLFPDRINYDKQEYSIMALNRRNGKISYLLEQGLRPVESLWTEGFVLISGKEDVFYMQRYTNRIYKIKGEDCVPYYELDLGKFEIPDYLLEEGIDKEYFSKEVFDKWAVFSLTNFSELPGGFMLNSNLPGFFYYNSKKKSLDHIDGIINEKYGIDFNSSTLIEPAGKNVAFVLDEYRLSAMKEKRVANETPLLKALLDHLPDDSNPVLFLYSVKR